MNALEVDTAHLGGFAEQLDRTADGSLGTVARYIDSECRNFERIDGVLAPLRDLLSTAADNTSGAFHEVGDDFRRTADNLRDTAGHYQDQDAAAANVLTDAGSAFGFSSPSAQTAATVTPYPNGGDVALQPPPDQNDIDGFKEQIEGVVGDWVGIVEQFTGFNVVDQLTQFFLGDPGALRRLGAAWGEVAAAADTISETTTSGADQLAGHWSGTAAAACDLRVREGHARAVTVLGDVAVLFQDSLTGLARVYENALRAVISMLRIRGLGVQAFVKEIKELVMNPAKLLSPDALHGLVDGLVGLVTEIWELIQEAAKSVVNQCMMVWDLIRTTYHGLVLAVDLAELKTLGFAPLPSLPG